MKCVYCQRELHDGDENGFYTCQNYDHQGIKITYLCAGSVRNPHLWILGIEIRSSECIWILSVDKRVNSLTIIQQFHEHSGSIYHLKLDYVPADLSPSNAKHYLDKLLNLKVFA